MSRTPCNCEQAEALTEAIRKIERGLEEFNRAPGTLYELFCEPIGEAVELIDQFEAGEKEYRDEAVSLPRLPAPPEGE